MNPGREAPERPPGPWQWRLSGRTEQPASRWRVPSGDPVVVACKVRVDAARNAAQISGAAQRHKAQAPVEVHHHQLGADPELQPLANRQRHDDLELGRNGNGVPIDQPAASGQIDQPRSSMTAGQTPRTTPRAPTARARSAGPAGPPRRRPGSAGPGPGQGPRTAAGRPAAACRRTGRAPGRPGDGPGSDRPQGPKSLPGRVMRAARRLQAGTAATL